MVKEDPNFILSPGHPELSNATPPRSTNATRQRKKGGKVCKDKKRKRLSAFDVVRIVQSKKIKTRLELMALASKWQEEGRTDLAEFVSNRGPKTVNEAIETAKELDEAQERNELINQDCNCWKRALQLSVSTVVMGSGYQLQVKF